MRTARKVAALAGVAVTLAASALVPSVVATADDGRGRHSRPRTVHVTGEQIPIPGTPDYTMTGDLVGTWLYNARTPSLHDAPTLYAEAGTEIFLGCLDRNHDGDCGDRRDRGGEMRTVFLYWASFNADPRGNRTTLIQGQCVHPVVGGRDTFRGSRGVLDMVDRLEDGVVKTTYSGDIVLNAVPNEPAAEPARAASAAVPDEARSAPGAAAGSAERKGC
jgi:hypothetical protein